MKLAYRQFGNGHPLIILHGLYGSGDNWFTVGKALSKHFEVFLIDQRNHGLSPHQKEMSSSLMTSDLEEFFNDKKIENAHIVGHSMGGKIAMHFALQNPEKISKLVVVDVAMKSYQESENLKREVSIHRKIIDSLGKLDISNSRSRADIDLQLSDDFKEKSLRDFLLKNLKRRSTGEFYWSINIQSLKENLLNILEEVESGGKTFNKPVLLVVGKKSDYVTKEDYVQFRKVFPNIRIEEIEAGHWIHAEQPERTIELLKEFLI
jgi:esterase